MFIVNILIGGFALAQGFSFNLYLELLSQLY